MNQNQRRVNRYFIFDCNDSIVGSTLGYSTYMEACNAQSESNSPVMAAMWRSYELKQFTDTEWLKIGSIRAKYVEYVGW